MEDKSLFIFSITGLYKELKASESPCPTDIFIFGDNVSSFFPKRIDCPNLPLNVISPSFGHTCRIFSFDVKFILPGLISLELLLVALIPG